MLIQVNVKLRRGGAPIAATAMTGGDAPAGTSAVVVSGPGTIAATVRNVILVDELTEWPQVHELMEAGYSVALGSALEDARC